MWEAIHKIISNKTSVFLVKPLEIKIWTIVFMG